MNQEADMADMSVTENQLDTAVCAGTLTGANELEMVGCAEAVPGAYSPVKRLSQAKIAPGKAGYTLRNGCAADIPGLKQLWKTCFDDEDAYIDAFFDVFYEGGNVVLAEQKGVLMGASFFLPGRVYLHGGWQDIRYVYALATYPVFRGQGVAGGLLRHAYAQYHAPLIAEPAEESLVGGFYEPFGFCASFYIRQLQTGLSDSRQQPGDARGTQQAEPISVAQEPERTSGALQAAQVSPGSWQVRAAQSSPGSWQIQAAQLSPNSWQVQAADAKTYRRIRERYFRNDGYISWPLQHVAFAISEHKKSGGGAFVLTREGREELLLYYCEDGQAVVTETTLAWEEVRELFDSCFFEMEGVQPAGLKARVASGPAGGQLVGVSYGLPAVYGYLNLSLD